MDTFKKVLKSKKEVEMRMANGLDDILCYQLTGKTFTEKSIEENKVGLGVTQQAVMTILTLVSYNGVPIPAPQTLEDAFRIAAKLPLKDWNEVQDIFNKLNEGEVEELEVVADEKKAEKSA